MIVKKTISVWSGDTLTYFEKVPMLEFDWFDNPKDYVYMLSLAEVTSLIQDMSDRYEKLKKEKRSNEDR